MKQRECCDLRSQARVLILSQRAWNRIFYIPSIYEFEDVVASIDSAHILAPPFARVARVPLMMYRGSNFLRAKYGLVTDPGIPEIELERDYDLFFCCLNFPYEIPAFKRIKQLRKRCKRAVCVFQEIWSSQAERFRRSLEILNELEFDHVFVNQSACLPAIRKVVRRPCSFLPLAVDAVRFAPYPNPPERVIDYYSMGRRSEATHKALLELSAARGTFYYFDSAVRSAWIDCFDHRRLFANLLKRTRFLMAHKASLRAEQVIGKDEILTGRLFEAAAAGAIALGTPPTCRDFDEHFDWPDAVIPVPYECEDMADIMDELDSQPERIALARQANVVQSLLRHDWSHRWQRVLESAGMEPLPALRDRQSRLLEMADRIGHAEAPAALG